MQENYFLYIFLPFFYFHFYSNCGEFEKYKCKLNRYNELFINWQKAFAEEKSKKLTKKP